MSVSEDSSKEPVFPLEVYFCEDCTLVQLLHVVAADTLFRHYLYLSGTSSTIAAHNVTFAKSVVRELGLSSQHLVAEVASNDGSLLKCFQTLGLRTLGIEPARNIARMANERGIETVNEFFDSRLARDLKSRFGPAHLVVGNNVLAHVDDTSDFLTGCRELLAPGGRVVIEAPYLEEMIDKLEYDTIYHEHLCYFSVTALLHLYEAAGLKVVRIERVPVHGGSLRIFAGSSHEVVAHCEEALAMRQKENAAGLTRLETYERFANAVRRNRSEVRRLLGELRLRRHTIAAYGAAAKGSTLTNYCGLDTRFIEYCVDKNPLKVGRMTPGMHIPVLPVATLLERRPDFLLILAWNFAEEIMEQQSEFRKQGGRFIIPVPEPRIV